VAVLSPDQAPVFPANADDDGAYALWRAAKLAGRSSAAAAVPIQISDPQHLSRAERRAIADQCGRRNFALYQTDKVLDGVTLVALSAQVGLRDIERPLLTEGNGVTELAVANAPEDNRRAYIPYSDKPLAWHTDGYNNPTGQWVRGMVLHYLQPAPEGGALSVRDPDLAYIRLRDANPAWVSALCDANALTIPANDLEKDCDGGTIRGAVSGPVFAEISGRLVMRYTHRQRHAIWRDTAETKAARAFLRDYLDSHEDLAFEGRLGVGQGIISNNVLHRRQGFDDAPQGRDARRVLRARFRNYVADIADV